MICTLCKHLDAREGECRKLNWQVTCSQCGKPYPITDIRCPRCALRSTDVAGVLVRSEPGGPFEASPLCPLTDRERQSLKARQDAPSPLKQGELF